jgi:hypothetical protein
VSSGGDVSCDLPFDVADLNPFRADLDPFDKTECERVFWLDRGLQNQRFSMIKVSKSWSSIIFFLKKLDPDAQH